MLYVDFLVEGEGFITCTAAKPLEGDLDILALPLEGSHVVHVYEKPKGNYFLFLKKAALIWRTTLILRRINLVRRSLLNLGQSGVGNNYIRGGYGPPLIPLVGAPGNINNKKDFRK